VALGLFLLSSQPYRELSSTRKGIGELSCPSSDPSVTLHYLRNVWSLISWCVLWQERQFPLTTSTTVNCNPNA
jgi:hypothetical protein